MSYTLNHPLGLNLLFLDLCLFFGYSLLKPFELCFESIFFLICVLVSVIGLGGGGGLFPHLFLRPTDSLCLSPCSPYLRLQLFNLLLQIIPAISRRHFLRVRSGGGVGGGGTRSKPRKLRLQRDPSFSLLLQQLFCLHVPVSLTLTSLRP